MNTTQTTATEPPLLLIDETSPLPALPPVTQRPTPEEEAAFFAHLADG